MTEVVQPPISTRPSAAAPEPAFGGITRTGAEARADRPDFEAIQASPEFVELRRRFRRFAFPTTALFFTWYLTFVLLAAYARDFMAQRVIGTVNVGILLGLLQFVSTIAITIGYLRYARRRIDPQVARIRARAEADPR